MESNKVKLAKEYCIHFHEGEFRKVSKLPFSTHPISVAETLRRYGYDDEVTQCIALLHDAVEDTKVRMDEIQGVFTYEVSNGVYILSKNKGKVFEGRQLTLAEYKLRIAFARNKIKRVKIADIIDNTRDLIHLNQEYAERKIKDAEDFYIPLGKRICPIMIKELINNIENYKKQVAMSNIL